MPSQTPTELPSVAAAKFVAKVTGAYTIALQELLQDASFNEEMKRQREEEEEREKASRPKAAATPWSEFLRLERAVYSQLKEKPSLKDFMKRCSERYKTLSDEDRRQLGDRVEADTKRFDGEMENYYLSFPQTSVGKGSKRKREKDAEHGPKRKRDQAQDREDPGQAPKSAKKVKAKRARSVQPIHSDSEQSSVAENSEASA